MWEVTIMAYNIKITYTKPVEEVREAMPICPMYSKGQCAADVIGAPYVGTIKGKGDLVTNFEDYIKAQVAHPGLVAAMKQAAIAGEYVYVTDDAKAKLYAEEIQVSETFVVDGVAVFAFEVTEEAGE